MTKLNIHEAKTHLSRYLKKVEQGETILLCKNGEPVAQITPLSTKGKKRVFGTARGLIKIHPSFFDELTDKELPGFGLR